MKNHTKFEASGIARVRGEYIAVFDKCGRGGARAQVPAGAAARTAPPITVPASGSSSRC